MQQSTVFKKFNSYIEQSIHLRNPEAKTLAQSTAPTKKHLTTEKRSLAEHLAMISLQILFFYVMMRLWWLVNFKLINYNFFCSQEWARFLLLPFPLCCMFLEVSFLLPVSLVLISATQWFLDGLVKLKAVLRSNDSS